MIITVLLFVLGLVLICLGGDKLVDAAVAISRKMGIPHIVVGATIVSIGTTLPEILVSTTAAMDGSAAICAGNAFGSIICNTTLIAGLVQLIRPMKNVETKSLGWRVSFFFGACVLVDAVGFMTGELNRIVGILLLVVFLAYAYLNIRLSGKEGTTDETETQENVEDISLLKQLLILAVCAALLYVGANLLVDNGILIAQALGVPERVIAVTFIALGTSLPELMTSIVSLIKGYSSVGLGNIIGANLFNLLLVLGIPSAIAGIPLEVQTIRMDIPFSILVMAVLVFPIIWKKRGFRIQGAVLLAVYAVYCISSFV